MKTVLQQKTHILDRAAQYVCASMGLSSDVYINHDGHVLDNGTLKRINFRNVNSPAVNRFHFGYADEPELRRVHFGFVGKYETFIHHLADLMCHKLGYPSHSMALERGRADFPDDTEKCLELFEDPKLFEGLKPYEENS